MMVINNIFEIGDIVYLRTDTEQQPAIVTAIIVRDGGSVQYSINMGMVSYAADSCELSTEKCYEYE